MLPPLPEVWMPVTFVSVVILINTSILCLWVGYHMCMYCNRSGNYGVLVCSAAPELVSTLTQARVVYPTATCIARSWYLLLTEHTLTAPTSNSRTVYSVSEKTRSRIENTLCPGTRWANTLYNRRSRQIDSHINVSELAKIYGAG